MEQQQLYLMSDKRINFRDDATTADTMFASGTSGYFKVGVSKHPQNRLRELQSGCPFELHVLAVSPAVPAQLARSVESLCHGWLKEGGLHSIREWFVGSAEEVYDIFWSAHQIIEDWIDRHEDVYA